MVADLLEPREHGQHQAAPARLLALLLGALDLGQRVAHGGLVQRGLLLGERHEDLHLDLLGQIRDNRRVALEAAQNEGRGDAAQLRGGPDVAGPLDRAGEVAAELRLAAKIAGVQEAHDAPKLGEPVLHRGAGERHARL